MADVVEAPLDVSFQYPFGGVLVAQVREQLHVGVLCASSFPESVRMPVPRDLRHRFQRERVQSLHGPVVHRRYSQGSFLVLTAFLLDVDPFERLGFVALAGQGKHGLHLLGRRVPELPVYAGRFPALVRGHPAHCHHLGMQGVRQLPLQLPYPFPFSF